MSKAENSKKRECRDDDEDNDVQYRPSKLSRGEYVPTLRIDVGQPRVRRQSGIPKSSFFTLVHCNVEKDNERHHAYGWEMEAVKENVEEMRKNEDVDMEMEDVSQAVDFPCIVDSRTESGKYNTHKDCNEREDDSLREREAARKKVMTMQTKTDDEDMEKPEEEQTSQPVDILDPSLHGGLKQMVEDREASLICSTTYHSDVY